MKHYTSPRIQRAQLFLMKVSSYLEIACALVLIVAICIAFIPVPQNLYSLYLDNGFDLSDFMKKSFDLVIGVELLKMFCRHDIDSIVEVLLFSVARQMVIDHLAIKEALIGCVAVAGCLALNADTDAAGLKAAKSAALWLYSNGAGEDALTETLGVVTPWNTAADSTAVLAMQIEQVGTGILPGAVLDAATAEALTANELSLQGSEKHTKAERTAFVEGALAALGAE